MMIIYVYIYIIYIHLPVIISSPEEHYKTSCKNSPCFAGEHLHWPLRCDTSAPERLHDFQGQNGIMGY